MWRFKSLAPLVWLQYVDPANRKGDGLGLVEGFMHVVVVPFTVPGKFMNDLKLTA